MLLRLYRHLSNGKAVKKTKIFRFCYYYWSGVFRRVLCQSCVCLLLLEIFFFSEGSRRASGEGLQKFWLPFYRKPILQTQSRSPLIIFFFLSRPLRFTVHALLGPYIFLAFRVGPRWIRRHQTIFFLSLSDWLLRINNFPLFSETLLL